MHTVQVQLTKPIYGRISGAVLARRLLPVYIVIAIVAVAVLGSLLLAPPESFNFRDLLFPLIFALCFVAMPILQTRFAFGWKTYPTAAQPATYEFSEEGLRVDGETYHEFQAWENFAGVKQFKVAVVLFFTRYQIFIFPNDSFRSVQEQQEVLAFLQSHIPAHKQREMKRQPFRRFAIVAGIWLAIIIGVFLVLTLIK
jgi:hypothetical protein